MNNQYTRVELRGGRGGGGRGVGVCAPVRKAGPGARRDRWMDTQVNGQMDGWIDEQTDGRTDRF